MARLLPYILVGLGGFIGANARFLAGRGVMSVFDTQFPLGTFLINVSGSFLLGILGAITAQKTSFGSDALRLSLGVGFLGAFTTFSTFEFETHSLLSDGAWIPAIGNVVASVLIGLLAVRAGILFARLWVA